MKFLVFVLFLSVSQIACFCQDFEGKIKYLSLWKKADFEIRDSSYEEYVYKGSRLLNSVVHTNKQLDIIFNNKAYFYEIDSINRDSANLMLIDYTNKSIKVRKILNSKETEYNFKVTKEEKKGSLQK